VQYRGLTLDEFQERSIVALEEGRSVLVSAPTGTGKTVIADWIIEASLAAGQRVIYTAPVKALSNQKFRDYCRMHGEENVGHRRSRGPPRRALLGDDHRDPPQHAALRG
jgi:ATP-dependent RNA helicase DOB1